jgi:uncharacterized protein
MNTPAPIEQSKPASRDLTDNEFAELDALLEATPAPLEPLDVVMLDGFLCGVLVQPTVLDAAQWMPFVFDASGQALPPDIDPVWFARTNALVMQRHAALSRALAQDGWFDPLILEMDEEGEGAAQMAAPVDRHASTAMPYSPDPVAQEGFERLAPISKALMPWVTGWLLAIEEFPGLAEMPDEEIHIAMARLCRHLPTENADEAEVVATFDRELPLTTLDQAIEELVFTVADLWDLTRTS